MSSAQSSRKSKNGVFYTPPSIARLLASRAVDQQGLHILDPACGDGILLEAAAGRYAGFHLKTGPRLVGCDRFKPKSIPPYLEFVQSDFFTYKPDEKFDVILMNPPYIQSAKIDRATRERYYEEYARSLEFSHNLDLWAYFLIKCMSHLKEGGAMAAILPWSFLEAEYAQALRQWLARNFARIEVLVLEGAHFADTVKRVLLVWLYGHGTAAQSIQIACADQCCDDPGFRSLPTETWSSINVMACLNSTVGDLRQRLIAAGFRPMREFADITIGVVTGANRYFIQSEEDAAKLGFYADSILPILTSVEDLHSIAGSRSPGRVLIQFGRMTRRRRSYVAKGVRSHLNRRIHCQRRERQTGSWYKVDPGNTPDAFFSYRVARFPYLILNPDGYQCTNALHKIAFKNVCPTERRWIQLSLLSVFGQLLLETEARHYGNGILKIEPRLLKTVSVYVSRTEIPDNSYNSVLRHIADDDKESACAEATRIVAKEANLDAHLVGNAIAALNRIRNRRGALRLQMPVESFLP